MKEEKLIYVITHKGKNELLETSQPLVFYTDKNYIKYDDKKMRNVTSVEYLRTESNETTKWH